MIEEETQLIEIMEAGFPTFNPIYKYVPFYIRQGAGLINNGELSPSLFDEGGAIWQSKRSYDSIEALLDDAEAGIKKWADGRW